MFSIVQRGDSGRMFSIGYAVGPRIQLSR